MAEVTTGTLTVGDAKIPYRVAGTGPALALVHGTGPGSLIFDHLIDEFADRSTVILPEYSGSASAEDDGAPLTLEVLAGQVAAVLEETADGPVDLLGFSLGSLVAATVAATRPELVRRLILVNGWSGPDDVYIHNMMTTWQDIADNTAAFTRYATFTAFSPAFLNSLGRDTVEGMIGLMQPTPGTLRHIDLNLRADIRDLLPKIQAPTLVIGSTQDGTIPVQNARDLHTALPGSSYVEIDAGHAVIAERAEEFAKHVRDFVHAG
ncbi:alpha/beta fold hydrolase [Streptomyces pharetrae]|uniref:alpha/beta fold hydrolase n=1 Tax=Streptomyces pharetrae TaxID=291370 RepID=UPI00364C3756